MNTIKEKKSELRRLIKLKKQTLTDAYYKEKSSIIFKNVDTLQVVKESKYVMSYWSLPDEVNTHEWNQEKVKEGKLILLPCIVGDSMILRFFEGVNKMVQVPPFNILEPLGEIFMDYDKIDIIIVPGIAFDRSFNRLGRGKGFYDRFLKNIKTIKIGICFDFQLFDSIPADRNDITMDYIITEKEIIKR